MASSVLDLQGVLDVIESIPERMCGGLQPKLLYDFSAQTRGLGAVVEIGTCAGKSTIALAYGQITRGGSRIVTIDLCRHPQLQSNLDRAGLAHMVDARLGRSSRHAATWKEPIELLFIDGDHRYRGIVADIRSWSRFVVPGGVMVFHDYPGFDGVNETWQAVYRLVLSQPERWRVISDRQAGSLFAVERLPDPPPRPWTTKVANSVKWKLNNLKWYWDCWTQP